MTAIQPAVCIADENVASVVAPREAVASSKNHATASRNAKMAIGSAILFAAPTLMFLASSIAAI